MARLRKLWESLELEILSVLEASNRLRESAEWELCELTAKQTALLGKEISRLASEAERLGREIEELTGKAGPETDG